MNTLRLIPIALFTAELDAGFAELMELSCVSFISARIRAVCKTAGVAVSKLSKEEMRELATTAKEFILSKQYGAPYASLTTAQKAKHKDAVKDAVRKLDGSDVLRKAEAKAQAAALAAQTLLDASMKGADSLADTPTGDGKAALAAMTASEHSTLPRIRELCAVLTTARKPSISDVHEFARLVADFIA